MTSRENDNIMIKKQCSVGTLKGNYLYIHKLYINLPLMDYMILLKRQRHLEV